MKGGVLWVTNNNEFLWKLRDFLQCLVSWSCLVHVSVDTRLGSGCPHQAFFQGHGAAFCVWWILCTLGLLKLGPGNEKPVLVWRCVDAGEEGRHPHLFAVCSTALRTVRVTTEPGFLCPFTDSRHRMVYPTKLPDLEERASSLNLPPPPKIRCTVLWVAFWSVNLY